MNDVIRGRGGQENHADQMRPFSGLRLEGVRGDHGFNLRRPTHDNRDVEPELRGNDRADNAPDLTART